ncbi:MAG: hypothetical protein L0K82_02815, partial [Pisciglobus halotolerans]|nr:hypothetical protein [Pisciglobus halotolerans]
MIEKIMNSAWFARIIAIAFSVILFSYVNYENNGQYSTTNGGASVNSSEVITNLPIVIDGDKDRYYVTGLPESATIRLEGTTAILLNTVTTQNFDIVTPDLNELGDGEHTIKLEPRGLSKELSYSIYPSEVTISIEERKSVQKKVTVNFNEQLLAEGYKAGNPILDKSTVEISGSSDTINRIEHVDVNVESESDVKKDISQKVPVIVTDQAGNPLDVTVNPSEIAVTIPVAASSKKVPISLSEIGEKEADKDYTVALAEGQEDTVNLTGSQAALEDINELPVKVDLTDVKETTTKKISLDLPAGASSVTPESISVIITVESGDDQQNKSANDSVVENDSSKQSSSSASSSESSSSLNEVQEEEDE